MAQATNSQRLIKCKGPSDPTWKDVFETVHEVYWDKKHDLEHTMSVVKEKHSFSASKKQWTSKLEEWKLKKNVSSVEMTNIIRIQQKRKAEDEKNTRFTVRGLSVPAEKIERWQKRQKPDHENGFQCSSDIYPVTTPSDISYETPSEAARTPSEHDAPTPQGTFRDLEMPIDDRAALPPPDILSTPNLNIMDMSSISAMLPGAFGSDFEVPFIPQNGESVITTMGVPILRSREHTPTQESNEAITVMNIDKRSSSTNENIHSEAGKADGYDSDSSSVIEISRDEMYSSDSDSDSDSVTMVQEPEYQQAVNNLRQTLLGLAVTGEVPNLALHAAVRRGDVDLVRQLLDSGADIEIRAQSGMTPLHVASRSGTADVVSLLLEKGAAIEAKADGTFDIPFDISGRRRVLQLEDPTPLHFATTRGHLQVVEILLKHSADPHSIMISNGRYPLDHAVMVGSSGIVRRLLDAGAKVSDIAIGDAVYNGHVSIVADLLRNGHEHHYGHEKLDLNGYLEDAITDEKYDIARLFASAGAIASPAFLEDVLSHLSDQVEPDMQLLLQYMDPSSDICKSALLRLLCREAPKVAHMHVFFEFGTRFDFPFLLKHKKISRVIGDEDITRLFLKFTRNDFDLNALFLHTLQFGKETVARYLFSEGDGFGIPEQEFENFYDMSTATTGARCKFLATCFVTNRDYAGIDVEALLDDSISEGYVDAIEVLLDGGVMLEDPWSIIMNAILQGQPGVVALILNWMEITATELDSEFDQVLRLAYTEGRVSCFRTLLQRYGDLNTVEEHGRDLFIRFPWFCDVDIIEILHDMGFDINTVSLDGFPPIIRAIRIQKRDVAKVLLERGANPNITDTKYGESALWWAIRHCAAEIVDLLRAKGAREGGKSWGAFWRDLSV